MKSIIRTTLSLVILSSMSNIAANATTFPGISNPWGNTSNRTEEPFNPQEELAQFPGGDPALQKYILQNINYPTIAKAQGIEGRVIMNVTIDEMGKISDLQIVQAIGGGCEEEVVRVFSEMPSWNPTKQAGHLIKTKQLISVNFKL